MVLVAIAGNSEDTPSSSSASTGSGSKASSVPTPQDQRGFINVVESLGEKYKKAANDLQKSAKRKNRADALREQLESLRVKGWVGWINAMETTGQGNAFVSIQLQGAQRKIRVQSWNNELSDFDSNSLIPVGSDLFNKVANLSVGELVKFDGAFVRATLDYIEEQSFTENGSMTDPEFTMIFSDIRKP